MKLLVSSIYLWTLTLIQLIIDVQSSTLPSVGIESVISLFKDLEEHAAMTSGKTMPENVGEGKFLQSISIGKQKLQLSEVEDRIVNGIYMIYQSYPKDDFCSEKLKICPGILNST